MKSLKSQPNQQAKDAEEEAFKKYTEYIDTSDIIRQYYIKQRAYQLEHYFVHIDRWLATQVPQEQNRPLIIEADEGIGKKTLLVHWMAHLQKSKGFSGHDIIISHFCSALSKSQSPYSIIYQTLVKLREILNIKQKVHIHPEKLRKHFTYWLDLCQNRLQKVVNFNGRVFLIIEGIDNFIDSETQQESFLKMWLPETFPSFFKVIITADRNSRSFRYLKGQNCEHIHLQATQDLNDKIVQNYRQRKCFVSQEHHDRIYEIIQRNEDRSSLYLKTLLSTCVPYSSPDLVADEDVDVEYLTNHVFNTELFPYQEIEEQSQVEELFQIIINLLMSRLERPQMLKDTLCCLAITFKGLTKIELQKTVGFDDREWFLILTIFKQFFLTFRGYWTINNTVLKRFIENQYLNGPSNKKNLKKMHLRISETLKNSRLSVRQIEEIVHHFYQANDIFQVKQYLSNPEVFLLYFSPKTKNDMCRYWQAVQNTGYDPVYEFDRGLELFNTHFSPNSEELFTIILQISRFLKEFTDFETQQTPTFRHPAVKGKIIQFNEDQIAKNEHRKQYLQQQKEQALRDNKINQKIKLKDLNIIEELKSDDGLEVSENDSDPEEEDIHKLNYLQDMGILTELNKMKMTEKSTGHEPEHESLNVDVPSAQRRFISYFRKLHQDRTKRRQLYVKDTSEPEFDVPENDSKNKKDISDYNFIGTIMNFGKPNSGEISGQQSPVDSPTARQRSINHFDYSKQGADHQSLQSQQMSQMQQRYPKKDRLQKEIDAIDLAITPPKEPTFYYYKRWLWMTFPWVCLHIDKIQTFSHLIAKCYPKKVRYLSVEEDKTFTDHALKIVHQTKMKQSKLTRKQVTNEDLGEMENKAWEKRRIDQETKNYKSNISAEELSERQKTRDEIEKGQGLFQKLLTYQTKPKLGNEQDNQLIKQSSQALDTPKNADQFKELLSPVNKSPVNNQIDEIQNQSRGLKKSISVDQSSVLFTNQSTNRNQQNNSSHQIQSSAFGKKMSLQQLVQPAPLVLQKGKSKRTPYSGKTQLIRSYSKGNKNQTSFINDQTTHLRTNMNSSVAQSNNSSQQVDKTNPNDSSFVLPYSLPQIKIPKRRNMSHSGNYAQQQQAQEARMLKELSQKVQSNENMERIDQILKKTEKREMIILKTQNNKNLLGLAGGGSQQSVNRHNRSSSLQQSNFKLQPEKEHYASGMGFTDRVVQFPGRKNSTSNNSTMNRFVSPNQQSINHSQSQSQMNSEKSQDQRNNVFHDISNHERFDLMKKVQSNINEHSSKQLVVLQQKLTNLVQEYNLKVLQNKEKAQRLHDIIMLDNVQTVPKFNMKEDLQEELHGVDYQLTSINEQLKHEKEQSQRQNQIIEVCDVNKAVNEFQIEKLHQYQSNLKKQVAMSQKKMEEELGRCRDIQGNLDQIMINNVQSSTKNHELTSYLHDLISQKQRLDEQIQSSNDYIKEGIQFQKDAFMSNIMAKDQEQEILQKKEAKLQQSKIVDTELIHLQEQFQKYKRMFMSYELTYEEQVMNHDIPFFHSIQFKQLVDHIEEKKFLDKCKFERNQKLTKLKSEFFNRNLLKIHYERIQVNSNELSAKELQDELSDLSEIVEQKKKELKLKQPHYKRQLTRQDLRNFKLHGIFSHLKFMKHGFDESKTIDQKDVIENMLKKVRTMVSEVRFKNQTEEQLFLQGDNLQLMRLVDQTYKIKRKAEGEDQIGAMDSALVSNDNLGETQFNNESKKPQLKRRNSQVMLNRGTSQYVKMKQHTGQQ